MDFTRSPGVVVGAFKNEKNRNYSLKINTFVHAYFEIGRFQWLVYMFKKFCAFRGFLESKFNRSSQLRNSPTGEPIENG